ncbi:sigma-54-dependent Fis family transcriptional regulator [Bordetella genomosp. 1]|uniref:Sigma-54-dependent Fis family transcriptional regulator n=1 Tax=Bordetella genomosp. 1 TaxID=1395607 RepID=A0A261SSQ1_9BORD|nr:sigma-54 dependent transcriptional regulator [Bordetella genomosp. 1]OZI40416.1 sigma-54-dependent Fis family transcriptional regulator [Bordetella genomosp. 1]
MNDIQVLLIEDDTVLGGALLQRLRLEGIATQWVQSCAQAVELFRRTHLRPVFLLADIRLPDGSGEDLYRRLIPHLSDTTVVFATAYGDIAQAVRLVAAGANDYLTKPYDADALVARIRALLSDRGGDAGTNVLDNPLASGDSTAPLARQLERLAASGLPLLIEGETGAGKDRAARYCHLRSPRAGGPFVAVNCAALANDLVEAELFGHAKGAFSGASAARDGLFSRASGGTLYFDEIAELSPKAQALLLRVLEDGEYRPLGESQSRHADCRILVSTRCNVEEAVAGGRVRADLFYRVSVGRVAMPPLRMRADALDALTRCMLDELGRADLAVDAQARQAMAAHDWPGNVRELKNRITRACVMSDDVTLSAADIFPESKLEDTATLASTRLNAEQRAIQQAISESGGHMGLAAKALGISRTTLWKKLRAMRDEGGER